MTETPDTSPHGAQSPVTAAELALTAWEARERDPKRAVQLAREALKERPGEGVSGLAQAAMAIASVALTEPEEARMAAEQVQQLLTEGTSIDLIEVPPVLAETWLAALRASFLLEDLGGGIRAGQAALELARRHGLAALQARAHIELGALFGSRSLSSTALKHMRKGLAVLEENDLPIPPVMLNNLGNIYLNTDRAEEALGFYVRAREQFVAEADRLRSSLCRSNEGRALLRLGRVKEAVEALEEGVEWLEGTGNRTYYATSLSKAAIGHAQAGDVKRAEQRFEAALQALEGRFDPFEDEIRSQFGDFLMGEERFAEALTQYQRALERARKTEKSAGIAEMQERTARALAALGRFEEAYRALSDHLSAKERIEGESSSLMLRLQLLELEATVSEEHELNVVARQAMLEANRELRERTRHLEDLSSTDDLTGLYNRRHFRARLEEEEARAAEEGHDLVLMLVDVDHFKSVNDRFSHSVGDKVLVEFATLLRGALRGSDVVARWGGEEFAVLLPGFTREAAGQVAERMRRTVESHPWESFGGGLTLTVSIGVAALAELVPSATAPGGAWRLEALLELADARLYEAKRLGRNRVIA